MVGSESLTDTGFQTQKKPPLGDLIIASYDAKAGLAIYYNQLIFNHILLTTILPS